MLWESGGRAAVQIAGLLLLLGSPAVAREGVIPQPLEVRLEPGIFSMDAATIIRVPSGDSDAAHAAHYLVELWARTNGFALPVVAADDKGGGGAGAAAGVPTIAFRRESGFGPEAYGIAVTPNLITVSASTAAGMFYGAVTLWQLLPPEGQERIIPAQIIRDAPRYAWRGLMLDSARHVQSVAFIRSTIDWMAWHKLNVLHWHLTDDQGWRLEIRRYPRLTSVGAWRVEPDGTRYGGFYTQAEVRDIVRYAASRHVQIVPEIDMPGHATAAIAAYPFLGAAPSATRAVSASWGVHDHLFNFEPRTFDFLENVLSEVIELFPSEYIHIGGDEVVPTEWAASPQVQATARKLGISNGPALQAYFTRAIGGYLAAHGRRIIGWDEILRPGLERSAVVMSWHGVSGAHDAAVAGNDTILSPWPTLYFDNRQSTLPSEPPGRLKVVSLEEVYDFQPYDATLSQSEQAHVLGIQANLWTEHMQSEDRVEWMALPRAAALAEVAWSRATARNFADFLARLVPMFARYRAFGLQYSDSAFRPAAEIARGAAGFIVTLSTQVQHTGVGEIRYTLDGLEPSMRSTLYESPVALPEGTEIRAATFVDAERASRTWLKVVDAEAARRRDSHEMTLCSDAIGLLLEPGGRSAGTPGRSPLAVDIMNPCWIDRGVDLSAGPRVVAAVAPLPFNYQIGADTAKIRVGDARTPEGELEIRVDGCDTPVVALLPLAPATQKKITVLPAQRLPRIAGRHDLCLRFARPRLDPLWALDWIEIGE